MTEQNISLDRLEDTINLFGSFDENIRLIEHEMGVTVVSRDSALKVSGEDAESVMLATRAIENLMTLAARGESINEQNVRYVLQLVRSGHEEQIQQLAGDGLLLRWEVTVNIVKAISKVLYIGLASLYLNNLKSLGHNIGKAL